MDRDLFMNQRLRNRGFTMIEMAIVLLILGLLLGGGLAVLSTQVEMQKVKDTQRLLDETREALIGFAVVNGRLPRPATSATNGAENPIPCATEAACTGFIPWSTLGTSKLDGFGKIIRYSVTPAFANGNIALATVGTKTIQTRDSLGVLSFQAGQAICNATNPCIPAVIFSHGRNRWGTGDAGNALIDGSATNIDEDANNTGGPTATNFISRLPMENTAFAGGEFDDIVIWISPNILYNRLIQTGRPL